jgi:hypothetical protein
MFSIFIYAIIDGVKCLQRSFPVQEIDTFWEAISEEDIVAYLLKAVSR